MGKQITERAPELRRSAPRLLQVLSLVTVVTFILWAPIERTSGESVRYSWFWIAGGEIRKGDYVVFEQAHPIIAADGAAARLTKRVECVAGEHLQFDGAAFWCGAELLGKVIDKTWDGKPLTAFAWNGPVPQGQAFVMGEHPRSFDSRYFGFVETARLTRLVGLI